MSHLCLHCRRSPGWKEARHDLVLFLALSYRVLCAYTIAQGSTHAPRLLKLSLERMSWPAMESIGLDKDLDQMALFMWVREAIAACDPGQSHVYFEHIASFHCLQRWMAMQPTTMAGGTEALDKDAPHTFQTPLRT